MSETQKALDVHVTLEGSDPEIWRDLRVPASTDLDTLHTALQRAFGWEDRHLHAFTVRDAAGVPRQFTPFEETMHELDMETTRGVRLADVLTGVGATMDYEYDFGDGWDHRITLTGHAIAESSRITCLDGANRGPIEDSGGIGGYEEKSLILADPRHPDHADLAGWYEFVADEPVDQFDPAAFDLEATNNRLARLVILLDEAEVTAEERAVVLRPVRWLLERARAGGLDLTKDGYLKPAVVREALDELGWTRRFPLKVTSESQTRPILYLREQVQAWKLLRKYKGQFVETPAARTMRDDDAALWDHIAARTAISGDIGVDVAVSELARLVLADAMPRYMRLGEYLTNAFAVRGLALEDGTALSEPQARLLFEEARRKMVSLNVVGPVPGLRGPAVSTAAGVKFLKDVQLRQTHL